MNISHFTPVRLRKLVLQEIFVQRSTEFGYGNIMKPTILILHLHLTD